jgi:2-C-methyl-D-erythritol 4-phosphate cytidylyltransferase
LVEGNRENIKITTSTDLIVAEAFLKIRNWDENYLVHLNF